MKTNDVYGLEEPDLKKVLSSMISIFGNNFQTRNSHYKGGTYYTLQKTQYAESITLQANFNKYENDYEEKKFEHYKSLIYINTTNHCDEIKKKLRSIEPDIFLINRIYIDNNQ